MYDRSVKRVIDIVLASSMIVVSSPLLLSIAVAILLDDGPPVFFRQIRVGQQGRPFTMFKFRSMSKTTPDITSVEARGRVRITRVGRVIRITNLDEFPQLFNILQGAMSVVGPRPCLQSQHELLQMRTISGAINLKPGLTGLAQVNSFDGMSERAVASWDNSYKRRISLAFDLKILFRTFRYCLQRPPIY